MQPNLAPLIEHLLDRYAVAGVTIKRWPWFLRWIKLFDRRSTTFPYAVRLRNTAWVKKAGNWILDTTDPKLVILLAHELVHVERNRAPRPYGFSKTRWYVKYLANSTFRAYEEVLAYAVAACWRAALAGKKSVESSDCKHSLKPGGVYWLPKDTDPAKMRDRILLQAQLHWAEISADIQEALAEWPQ